MADPIDTASIAGAAEHAHRTGSFSRPLDARTSRSQSQSRPPLGEATASTLDPDTCRICRGEGSTDEPLFYPCKCSGSIKYVHQNCLMEWLSHSQKKHCELCKTPFRFTKLYSPTMPKRLPHLVFARHVAKYLLRDLLVWLRGLLVISVWLVWLPYLMRSVWAFLFWISDEGLGGGSLFTRGGVLFDERFNAAGLPIELTTCSATPLLVPTTCAAALGPLLDGVAIDQFSDSFFLTSFYGVNVTTPDPVAATLLRYLFGSIGLTSKSNKSVGVGIVPTSRHPSLLSEVSWLKNLTRSPTLNRTIITVLEGQIITVLVIVCFILIILVRDYVVQQQPEINMRAAFAAQDNAAPNVRIDEHAPLPEVELIHGMDDDTDFETVDSDDHPVLEHEAEPTENAGHAPDVELPQIDAETEPQVHLRPRPTTEYHRPRSGSPSSSTGRKDMGELDLMDRGLDAPPDSAVSEYLRIYRLAGGDPVEILRIVEEEHLEDRLGYWVRVTKSMLDKNRTTNEPKRAESVKSDAASWNTVSDDEAGPSAETTAEQTATEASHAEGFPGVNSSLPIGPPTPSPLEEESWAAPTRRWKGKAKEVEPWDGAVEDDDPAPQGRLDMSSARDQGDIDLETPTPDAIPSRARAVSDGPPLHNSVNPLANNSWTFASLPESQNLAVEPIRERPESSDSSLDTADGQGYPTPPSSTAVEQGSSSRAHSSRGGSEAAQEPVPAPPNHPDTTVQANWPPQPTWTESDRDRLRVDHAFDAGSDTGSLDVHVDPRENLHGRRRPREQPQPPPEAQRLVDRFADFMWGGVEPLLADAEVQGDVNDLLLLPADDMNERNMLGLAVEEPDFDPEFDQDREAEEAAAAGLDPEAIEDAEDLEGILELIGMRGPIAGLFQNAVFCAVLVSVTIFLCIFLPYNIGRMTVWGVANPMRLVRMAFGVSKFLQDLVVAASSLVSCTLVSTGYMLTRTLGWQSPQATLRDAAITSWGLSINATNRVLDTFITEFPIISTSEMQNFSAISHEALLSIKDQIAWVFSSLGAAMTIFSGEDRWARAVTATSFAFNASASGWETIRALSATLLDPSSWVINFSVPEASASVNADLSYWSGADRFWAILCGYLTVSFLAALYLRRGTPFSTGQLGQEWEASIIDVLKQASGVMKVILIISIEMLIFPLYCGLLLDVALLPLFENTTMKSRVYFTLNFPLTSMFVHWFVGTGYMFHFALFVSMCRKIMRRGVLYFIRDPDDPEFHPVRDVLERNVTTQLRKILFSAFVYGALVIVCLGGVVWGLALALPGVLPIHYSSNEPVLEFPIDLLFYNFLMPLAVKFFKPSDGLHTMYTWWFRKCARGLRITWFLFGERRIDEEGILVLPPDSPYFKAPWWRRRFLEVNNKAQVIPKTWHDAFEGGLARPTTVISERKMKAMTTQKQQLVASGQLIPDGRFVRTPASDQVKIPKGKRVFFEVNEQNGRLDGGTDTGTNDLYASSLYQLVYVPPHFRLRVFLFILFIWMFAAVTGVGFTIVPLIFGRRMFKQLIPAHIRTNDIYAFSIGIYVLGSVAYSLFHMRSIYARLRSWFVAVADKVYKRDAPRVVAKLGLDAAKITYAYTILLFVFPLLLTAIVELYLIIPLHTYMYPIGSPQPRLGHSDDVSTGPPSDKHTVRVIQVWTLGLLYLKLGARLLTTLYDGRPVAVLVRAVLHRGWLHPNVGVLTRAFVVPGLAVGIVAIVGPPFTAYALLRRGLIVGLDPMPSLETMTLVYRLSYPVAALTACGALAMWSFFGIYKLWQARIRDEAYLIGERLHNFGIGAAGNVRGRRPLRGGGLRW